MNHTATLIGIAVCCLLLACCTSKSDDEAQIERFASGEGDQQLAEQGYALFRNREFGTHSVACADCHPDYIDSINTQRIYPGHSVLGAAARYSSWYGEFSGDAMQRYAAGASKCALIYQKRGTGLDDALSESESKQLTAFFRYISTGKENRNISWQALSYPGDPNYKRDSILAYVDSLNTLKGNAERGKDRYAKACLHCHSDGSRIAQSDARALRRYTNRIFFYVRAGKGLMPFFSYDKLSNQDVADIKEWIYQGAR